MNLEADEARSCGYMKEGGKVKIRRGEGETGNCYAMTTLLLAWDDKSLGFCVAPATGIKVRLFDFGSFGVFSVLCQNASCGVCLRAWPGEAFISREESVGVKGWWLVVEGGKKVKRRKRSRRRSETGKKAAFLTMSSPERNQETGHFLHEPRHRAPPAVPRFLSARLPLKSVYVHCGTLLYSTHLCLPTYLTDTTSMDGAIRWVGCLFTGTWVGCVCVSPGILSTFFFFSLSRAIFLTTPKVDGGQAGNAKGGWQGMAWRIWWTRWTFDKEGGTDDRGQGTRRGCESQS